MTILQGAEELLSLETWEPIVIGRQTGRDQKPPSYRSREQKCRVTLAGRDSAVVSREHLLIEAQDAGRIRVTNQSQRHVVQLPNRVMLKARESQELSLPASLGIANWVLRVEVPNAEDAPLRALEEAPPSPLASIGQRRPFAALPISPDKENAAEQYLRFLEISLIRLQASADVKTLCDQAASCCAELLELDSVWVFLLEENEWAVKAWARRGDVVREKAGDASRFVLGKVREERRTFWLTSQAVGIGVLPSVAAAPLLDAQGAVIGAIYGHRLATSDSSRVPVNRLLALSVELLASAVSSALVRMQQGQGHAPSGSFADFFPPQVSRRVADAPQILDDREQEIALLECEIRDFDAVFAQLGPTEAALRLQEVFDPVCECIWDQQGVVNDYRDARVRAFFGGAGGSGRFPPSGRQGGHGDARTHQRSRQTLAERPGQIAGHWHCARRRPLPRRPPWLTDQIPVRALVNSLGNCRQDPAGRARAAHAFGPQQGRPDRHSPLFRRPPAGPSGRSRLGRASGAVRDYRACQQSFWHPQQL